MGTNATHADFNEADSIGGNDGAPFRRAANAIATALGADDTVYDQLLELLVASGRLPPDIGETADARYDAIAEGALEKLLDLLRVLLEVALPHALDDDRGHLIDIRRFFLEPRESYSVGQLAALWRSSADDVRDLYHDELGDADADDPESSRIAWADAVGTSIAFNLLRPYDVERALGADFNRVRPDSWRTIPLLIHLPRFMVDALAFEGSLPCSNRTQSARLEQFLFALFPDEHRTTFAAALGNK